MLRNGVSVERKEKLLLQTGSIFVESEFSFYTETVLTWCFQVQGEQTFLFQDREEGEGEEEGKG